MSVRSADSVFGLRPTRACSNSLNARAEADELANDEYRPSLADYVERSGSGTYASSPPVKASANSVESRYRAVSIFPKAGAGWIGNAHEHDRHVPRCLQQK